MKDLNEVLKWVNNEFMAYEYKYDKYCKYDIQLHNNPELLIITNVGIYNSFGRLTLKCISDKLEDTVFSYIIWIGSKGRLQIIIS